MSTETLTPHHAVVGQSLFQWLDAPDRHRDTNKYLLRAPSRAAPWCWDEHISELLHGRERPFEPCMSITTLPAHHAVVRQSFNQWNDTFDRHRD